MHSISKHLPLVRAASMIVAAAMMHGPAWGAPLTFGNVIVSVNEFTGSSTAPTYIAEYTPSGSRVQILANVPIPGTTTTPTTDQARDLVLGPGNAIYLYNGTFDPYLARLDLTNFNWSQQTFGNWSTVNNGTYGGLARMGNYVFASDMATPTGDPQGIIRFDLFLGTAERFATGIAPSDIAIGLDGTLYAINGASSPTNLIHKFNPTTLASLGTISVPFEDYRGVAAAADGTLFATTFDGVIMHLSSTGTLLDSINVPTFLADIDLAPNGKIVTGTAFYGEVVFTDTNLDSYTKFRATDSTSGGETFVAWVTTPEPGSAILLCGGLIFTFGLARRRRA